MMNSQGQSYHHTQNTNDLNGYLYFEMEKVEMLHQVQIHQKCPSDDVMKFSASCCNFTINFWAICKVKN